MDIGVGVRWLREVAGVEVVVLLGNCGGGSLMATYQAQATAPSIAPTRGLTLPEAVGELPAGDLYVSLQAHPGHPEVLTTWLDPSVVDEADPLATDRSLDMFDPANGPPYDDGFVAAYRAAQEARNHRITDWVQDTVTSIVTHRCNNRKPLIATTNLPDADAGSSTYQKTTVGVEYRRTLRDHIGDRARSRLFEMCKVIKLNWSEDYRIRRGKRF